jgi:PRTRC genetic system ThiF family protein
MDEMNFEKPLELILPNEKHIALILVGCGGTGSWLAPAVTRVGKILIERFNREVSIYFIDPDRIEEKNIYRQNFCAAEVGMNKAEALAMRYGLAWGIEIHAMARKYSQAEHSIKGLNQMIVIGCVDRTSARKEIAGRVNSNDLHVWLDCGNSESYGQILLGVKSSTIDIFPIPGKCSGLPMPNIQHPELVKDEKINKAFAQPAFPFSCADMALRDSQGLAINQRMAAEAADYLVRMLITQDLKKFATYIDLESGTTRSKYITEKAVNGYGKG